MPNEESNSPASSTPDPSVRETIRSVVQEQTGARTEPEPSTKPESEAKEPQAPEERQGRARDHSGRFAKPTGQEPSNAQEPEQPAERTETQPTAQEPKRAASKAPQSLPSEYRRDWEGLKPDLQAAILKREGQMSQRLRETAQDRKFKEDFEQVVRPFAGKLTAPPLQRFGELLQTADRLSSGSPEEKADLAAQLFQEFGISLEAFVARLESGRPLAPQYRDPRLDALEKRLNGMDAAREQQRYSEITQRVEEFAQSKTHFDKVQARMARLADAAAARGEEPSLDTLYEEACWLEPEVRTILMREQATQGTASAATQRARAASTSPRTNPTSAPVTEDDSIKGLLRAGLRSQSKQR